MTSTKHGKWVLIAVWFAMVAATVGSLFASRSTTSLAPVAVLAVLALAYVKCRLVVSHFMEVRQAPTGWRIAFELWMALSVIEIAGFRFLA